MLNKDISKDSPITPYSSNNRKAELKQFVYIDDIILTGDDTMVIERLKKHLAIEFEVKDL